MAVTWNEKLIVTIGRCYASAADDDRSARRGTGAPRLGVERWVMFFSAVWASRTGAGGTPWAELFALGLASQLGLLEHCSPILV